MPVDPDLELAASLATGAGELLEGLRRRGSPTGTEGDLARLHFHVRYNF